jgi:hypothetical protein
MIKRLAYTAIMLTAAVCSPSLLAHLVAPTGASEEVSSNPEDDGWRLTRQGWEQLSPRVLRAYPQVERSTQSAVGPAAAPATPSRFDVHPAALALLLVLGAIGAFCMFPNQAGFTSRQRSESLF